MRWQVQEAKQRFSELLRKAEQEGPQPITRHGQEVAYVVDVAWYRQALGENSLAVFLAAGPHSETYADVLEEVIARRADDQGRDVGSLFDDDPAARP